MIHSMTGYGKAEAEYNGKKIHVEIKSLNSKNLDLNTRIATAYREKEMALRKLIAAELLRGKVDFTVWCEKASESAGSTINAATVADYVQQIQTVSAQVDGLAAPVRPDEAFDDVQGLWQRCPAACRLVLQCRSGKITGIWQASQKPTNTKDRVGRQEFLP